MFAYDEKALELTLLQICIYVYIYIYVFGICVRCVCLEVVVSCCIISCFEHVKPMRKVAAPPAKASKARGLQTLYVYMCYMCIYI